MCYKIADLLFSKEVSRGFPDMTQVDLFISNVWYQPHLMLWAFLTLYKDVGTTSLVTDAFMYLWLKICVYYATKQSVVCCLLEYQPVIRWSSKTTPWFWFASVKCFWRKEAYLYKSRESVSMTCWRKLL